MFFDAQNSEPGFLFNKELSVYFSIRMI